MDKLKSSAQEREKLRGDLAASKVYTDLIIEKTREEMRSARESSIYAREGIEDFDEYNSEYSYNTNERYPEELVEEELRRRRESGQVEPEESVEEEFPNKETTEVEPEEPVEEESSNKETTETGSKRKRNLSDSDDDSGDENNSNKKIKK
jgi:hypothetical protein